MFLNKNILRKKNPDNEQHFRLSRKELTLTLISFGLAMASLKTDDPLVVIPMLCLAGVCGVLVCCWHTGPIWGRSATAILITGIFLFIGWRELKKTPSTTDEVFKVSISNVGDLSLNTNLDVRPEEKPFWFWFTYRSGYGDTVSPLPAVIYTNITNLTDSLQTVSSYHVSVKTDHCDWIQLSPIPIRTGKIFWAYGGLKRARLVDFSKNGLDFLLLNPIPAKQTVSGWWFFDSTVSCPINDGENVQYQIRLETYAGGKFEYTTPPTPWGIRFVSNGNPEGEPKPSYFQFTATYADLSHFHRKMWSTPVQ